MIHTNINTKVITGLDPPFSRLQEKNVFNKIDSVKEKKKSYTLITLDHYNRHTT